LACLLAASLLAMGACSQPTSTSGSTSTDSNTTTNNNGNSSSSNTSGLSIGNNLATKTDTTGFSLVWQDEFDTSGTKAADAAGKWKYETEDTVGYGWGNNEAETYRASDANGYVSDGTLKIVALNSGGTWTSARLNSTVSLRHGMIEARIKVPSSQGTWPAFWLLPEAKGWPDTGEIDIMEHSPTSWGIGHILTSLHAKNHSGDNCVHIGDKTDTAFADSFHTYAIKWTETSIAAYYDGVLAGTPYTKTASMTSADWPYNDGKFYIIINLAMGGTIGGTIPSDLKSATMEVDYVRIYQ
jgi:beta-glucanase (GH16 family)